MKKTFMIFFYVIASFLGATDVSESKLRDLYLWPKYSKETKEKAALFLEGETFDLWDYGNIYDTIPQKYAQKLGVKHAFFCSSGTSALHASLMAIGLKRGDRIAVPAMTFIRSITPLVHMGLEPVLVDIEPHTGNLDPESLKKVKDEKIKAVIVVHMWGVPANIEKISEIAKEKKWKLIEDFSHAHFSQCRKGYAGTFGDIGFASLQRKKTLSVGEGGIITTNDDNIFQLVRQIVSPGSYDQPQTGVDHSGFGLNMRMSPMSAIIADGLYNDIDAIINTRSGSAEKIIGMLRLFPDVFEVPLVPEYVNRVSWYTLRPKISVSLEALKQASKGTKWKFDVFEYPMIADHVFWNKNQALFPFSEGVNIVNKTDSFPGAEAYMNGRISVKVPSLSPEEWNEEMLKSWADDLAIIVKKLRAHEK